MKAAKNFTFGTEGEDGERIVIKAGEEIPKRILKEIDDSLILEKVAKNNPEDLSREQLLALAGITSGGAETSEQTEEEFREGLSQFNTKADLAEWADGVYGVELNPDDFTRPELEDQIVAFQFEDEFEDEEEDDEEEEED